MKHLIYILFSALLLIAVSCNQGSDKKSPTKSTTQSPIKIEEGFVDAHGVLIYYTAFGEGKPLLILHGGPGASHDYFLPYLLPLARENRLIFIDERGSGRSQKLDDPKGYTVENMVEGPEEPSTRQ